MKTVEQMLRDDHLIWSTMLRNEWSKENPNKLDIEILVLRVDTLQKVIDQVDARKID